MITCYVGNGTALHLTDDTLETLCGLDVSRLIAGEEASEATCKRCLAAVENAGTVAEGQEGVTLEAHKVKAGDVLIFDPPKGEVSVDSVKMYGARYVKMRLSDGSLMTFNRKHELKRRAYR